MSKSLKAVLIVSGIFVVTLGLAATYFAFQFMGSGISNDTTEVYFDVMPGQSMPTVAENLEKRQLIKNAYLFTVYTRMTGANPKLKRGEYALRANMTPSEIINVITSGKSVARNLTIVEGATVYDVADAIERGGYGTRQEVLQLANDREFIKSLLNEDLETLEGYLFPETYKVTKFDSVREILAQMTKRFLVVWQELSSNPNLQGWTRNQVVTLASIVEKETGASKDRPLVASVFHNRLQKKMRLQTDPTVLYGLAVKQGDMPKNITRADLTNPTRYNTYTIDGLPPTPISNPGKSAFLATFEPAKTNYLYFVSRNDGTTAFSATLQAHNSAVQTYQVNPKGRDGKSWRDMNKPSTKPEN